jgi:hypothetical protein
VHSMGGDVFSFGEGVRLQSGELTLGEFEGFGRPPRNPIETGPQLAARISARPI